MGEVVLTGAGGEVGLGVLTGTGAGVATGVLTWVGTGIGARLAVGAAVGNGVGVSSPHAETANATAIDSTTTTSVRIIVHAQ